MFDAIVFELWKEYFYYVDWDGKVNSLIVGVDRGVDFNYFVLNVDQWIIGVSRIDAGIRLNEVGVELMFIRIDILMSFGAHNSSRYCVIEIKGVSDGDHLFFDSQIL